MVGKTSLNLLLSNPLYQRLLREYKKGNYHSLSQFCEELILSAIQEYEAEGIFEGEEVLE